MSAPCPHGLCDGGGFVIDEATNTASDCRCRPGLLAALRVRKLEARIPRRYRDLSFDRLGGSDLVAYPAQVEYAQRFAARIDENLAAGRGLWIYGDVGTGKTTLAMLVSKAALAKGRTVAIYSMPRLLNKIREAIEGEHGKLGFLDRLCAVDLLHIDDVGAEHRTDWTLEQLYSIVNTRYEDARSIVLTTNAEPKELIDQIGERIVSRLVEMCGDPLPLYGADHRRPDYALERR
jgi:DNA replication protein DnaC